MRRTQHDTEGQRVLIGIRASQRDEDRSVLGHGNRLFVRHGISICGTVNIDEIDEIVAANTISVTVQRVTGGVIQRLGPGENQAILAIRQYAVQQLERQVSLGEGVRRPEGNGDVVHRVKQAVQARLE